MKSKTSKEEKIYKNKETGFGRTATIIVISILVILMAVPTFTLFSKRGRGEGVVFGKFATEDIIYGVQGANMTSAINSTVQQYQNFFGMDTDVLLRQEYIWSGAFELASVNAGIDYYAKKAGVYVSDEEVNDYIIKEYVNDDGIFNKEGWLSMTELERKFARVYMKDYIQRDKIMNDIKNLSIPQKEVDAIHSEKQSKADEGVTIFKEDIYKDIENMSESRLRDSILKSSLLINNFEDVYKKEIEPLYRETNTNQNTNTTSTTDSENDVQVADDNVNEENLEGSDTTITEDNTSN